MSEKEDPHEPDEEIELTEEYEEDTADTDPVPTPADPKPPENATPPPPPAEPIPPAEKSSIGEVPFTLVIEAARLPLTLDKILQLQKGNVLPLPQSPESGVDIVISGTCIARGELIKVGDRLAVRILDI